MGVSLLIFFVMMDFPLGLASVMLAHIAFHRLCRDRRSFPSCRHGLGADRAARDCGATPWRAFRHVTLPLIMPASSPVR
jgi:spermidine/putrescine transport system permease protein